MQRDVYCDSFETELIRVGRAYLPYEIPPDRTNTIHRDP